MKQKILVAYAALSFAFSIQSSTLTFRGFENISVSFYPALQAVQRAQQVVRPVMAQPVLQAMAQPALQVVVHAPVLSQSLPQIGMHIFNKYGPTVVSVGMFAYMGYLAWKQHGVVIPCDAQNEATPGSEKTEAGQLTMLKENDRNAQV